MLFDPQVLLDHPGKTLVVAAIVMLGKTVAAVALVLAFRYPLNTALTVGASLAQIGEFSFILVGLGVSLGLLPVEGQSLVLAGALLSIALNPLVFAAIEPVRRWALGRSAFARELEQRDAPYAALPESVPQEHLTGHIVVVGHGRVGRRLAEALAEHKIPHVVVEQSREIVEALRKNGVAAVSGDASEPVVLVQAHVARAGMLVIATPDTLNVRNVVQTARTLNPAIEVVLRTHSEEEAGRLRAESLGEVFMGEHELARGMARHVLARMGIEGHDRRRHDPHAPAGTHAT
jgi:CPA2 family monovalent cation:H+ antiporter-2